jgi:hypothetical protein
VILVGVGIDALILSRVRARLPWWEIDKLFYGDQPGPPFPDESRRYMERNIVVSGGTSTQILGIAFIVLGLVVGAAGLGLL